MSESQRRNQGQKR